MAGNRCPICKSSIDGAEALRAKTFPFCSDRCRNADLFRWLDEGYSVPVETNRVAANAVEEIERGLNDHVGGVGQN